MTSASGSGADHVDAADRLDSSAPAVAPDSALTMEALRDECDHLRSLLRAIQASSKDARVGYMMTMSRTIELLREQLRQKNKELESMTRTLQQAQQIASREGSAPACSSNNPVVASPNPRNPLAEDPSERSLLPPDGQGEAVAPVCDVPTAPSLSSHSQPGAMSTKTSLSPTTTATTSSATVAKLRMELAAATMKARKMQTDIDMLHVTKQRLEQQNTLASETTAALQRRVESLEAELAAARAGETCTVAATSARSASTAGKADSDAPVVPSALPQSGRARSMTTITASTTATPTSGRPPFHRSDSQRGASVPSAQSPSSKPPVDVKLQELQMLREQLTESRAEVERMRAQAQERESEVALLIQQWEADSRAAAARETNLKESLDQAHETYEEEITQLNRVLSSWREDQQALASSRTRSRTGAAGPRSPSPTPRATPILHDATTSPLCSPSEPHSSPPPVPPLMLSQNLSEVHAECGILKERLRHAQERIVLLEESRRGLLAELSTIRHVYCHYGGPGGASANRNAATTTFWPTAMQGTVPAPPHTMRHPPTVPSFSHSSSWDFDALPHGRNNATDSPAHNSTAGAALASSDGRMGGHGSDGAGPRPLCVSPSNSARTDVEESSVSWTVESRLLLRLQDEILSLRQQIDAQGGPQRRRGDTDRGTSSSVPTEVAAARSSAFTDTVPRGDCVAAAPGGSESAVMTQSGCDPRAPQATFAETSAFLRQAMVHTAPVAMATVFVFLGALFGAVAARKA